MNEQSKRRSGLEGCDSNRSLDPSSSSKMSGKQSEDHAYVSEEPSFVGSSPPRNRTSVGRNEGSDTKLADSNATTTKDKSEGERNTGRGEGSGQTKGDDRRRQQQGRRDRDERQRTSRHSHHGYGDRRRSRSPPSRRGATNRDFRRRGRPGGDHYRRSRSRSYDRRRSSQERDRHSRRRTVEEGQRSNSPRDKRNRRSRSRDRPRYRRRPQSHSQSQSPDYCRSRPLMTAAQKTAINSIIPSKQNAEESKMGTEVQNALVAGVDPSNDKPSNALLKDPLQLVRSGHIVTAQMAVQQTMAAMSARAQQLTGVQLPKYYNPAAVNPLKYAEQMQKRKLLWHNKEKKETVAPSTNNWESTTFSQDQDGKMAAKFKKLMGIKDEGQGTDAKVPESNPSLQDHIRKQEELFRTLDQQYEVARISTHTQRGVGLGFSSCAPIQIPHVFPK